MEKPKFEFYTRPNGHNEFLEFYNTLPYKDRRKLMATIEVIEKEGMIVAFQLELVKKLDYEIYLRYQVIFNGPYTFIKIAINIS